MPSAAGVELEGVRFAYGDGVGEGGFRLEVDALVVERGARVACIGPSGTGKTTLVDLIGGVRVPDAGRISVEGREVSALGEDERRAWRLARVGMVFQEFELLEYLTALDNVLLPYHLGAGRPDAAARARAERLAERAGVAHLLRRLPARLSQGERQRIAVCRALVTEPALLLCDEGTGNLDPETAGATLELLFEQAREAGATVFFVTHDHGLLDRFDRVVDMRALRGGAAT
ncbi:MAG: ATP-binding cassette domain-containing protein [Planctomycetota bacterium]